jgi:hypothetical protein
MEQSLPEETPVYTLYPKKSRVIIPKIVVLVVLGVIFYLGILLNLQLLDLTATEEMATKIASLILILFLVFLGTYLAFRQAHQPYQFYRKGLVLGRRNVSYLEVALSASKRDWLDRIFHTYSLNLGSGNYLRHLPQSLLLENYLRQWQEYAQKNLKRVKFNE